jgi:uncharacterized protein YjdB
MSSFKQIALLAITVGSSWFLSGCEPNLAKAPAQPDLVSIAISPSTASLQIGGTQTLAVNGTFSDSSTKDLTANSMLLSSDPTVALVSATGVVTAKKAGTATITATHNASGKTATATITVLSPTLVSIAITPKPVSLAVGATQQLTVTATYSDASTGVLTVGLTFSSSSTPAATVNNSGLVQAVAAGSTTVTATDTASGDTDTVAVTVTGSSGGGGGWPTITFDVAAITYGRTDFGGVTSSQVADPAAGGAQLQVGKVVKPTTAQVWGGTTVSTLPGDQVPTIPFTATNTKMTVKVYSPAAGIHVRLKVEDAADGTHSVETEALTTMANAWETLTFDFAVQATGTAALNLAYTYNRASLFFDFGTVPVADETFYFDDIAFVTSGGGGGGGGTVVSNVFGGGALDAGVTFVPFGGSDNTPLPGPDAGTLFTDGSAALKVVITGAAGAYSGGAWVASAPRDLRTANALAFWAKASTAVTPPSAGGSKLLKVQIGNDGGAGTNVDFQVESIGLTVTTNWQQYIIPLPDPGKANGIDGLFSFAEGNDNYTLWLAKVQYVNVPGAALGTGVVSGDGFNGVPQPLSVPVGSTYPISPAPNSITWTLGASPMFAGSPIQPLANGGNLNNDAWRWFTLSSSNNAVATVSQDGVISGVSAGTATFTGTLPAGTAIPGQTTVTVTAPLATPTNYAAAPPLPQGSAISLFNSTNAYTNVPVDTWSTSWSACCNTLVDPFAIAGGNGVKQYSLNSFVGIEFGLNGTNAPVDASALSVFHVDVWSPNPSTNLEIQLVNDAAGTAAIGKFEGGQIAAGGWVSLDIPLASFAGLTLRNKINQLLFVAAAPSVLYVDNVYFH